MNELDNLNNETEFTDYKKQLDNLVYSITHNPKEEIKDTQTDKTYEKNKKFESKIKDILRNVSYALPNFKDQEPKITNYILRWNIWSWKNPDIEKQISTLSMVSREIRVLSDNPQISLEDNFKKMNEMKKSFEQKNFKQYQEKGLNYSLNTYQIKNSRTYFNKVKWFVAWIVDFFGIKESLRPNMRKMISEGEKYIGLLYKSWTMDCSMMVSILLCAFQWIKSHRLWTSWDFKKYPQVEYNEIEPWDLQCFPWHVEMVVSKPYTKNWITYVTTLWSSTDTNNVDPLLDKNWNTIKWQNGVWYRIRKIKPNPRHQYTYHRPPYNKWTKQNKT